jgi:HEPN domain-containing protein
MSDLEQARSLLRLARRDFNALVGMEQSPLFADEIFGFHAQQAIEKVLKALICQLGATYPVTHDLGRLISVLAPLGVDIDPDTHLARYTVFAVEARYLESAPEHDEPLDSTAVIATARALLDSAAASVA